MPVAVAVAVAVDVAVTVAVTVVVTVVVIVAMAVTAAMAMTMNDVPVITFFFASGSFAPPTCPLDALAAASPPPFLATTACRGTRLTGWCCSDLVPRAPCRDSGAILSR